MVRVRRLTLRTPLARQQTEPSCPAGWRPHGTSALLVRRDEENQPSKYELIDIDRTVNLGAMFPVVDAVTGLPAATRLDCALVNSCTWTEEAKNFANWYTYYRNRLFAAVAVTSQVLGRGDRRQPDVAVWIRTYQPLPGRTEPVGPSNGR